MPKPLFVHPQAQAEAQEAYEYLAERNPSAAARFAEEIGIAFDAIEEQPDRFPRYPYSKGQYRLLNRFPYVVVFEEEPMRTVVYAVAHTSRKPSFWKKRIRDEQ